MKIVCFRHFEDATQGHSPFCNILDHNKIDYYIFFDGHQIHHRRRFRLYFFEWPRLFFLTFFRTCWLLFGKKQYDYAVAWTHLEILPIVLLKKFFRRKLPRTVLSGFIFTPRRSSLRHCIRYAYFRWLLNQLDFIIVHSHREKEDYTKLFGFEENQFVFLPFGTHVNILSPDPNVSEYVFSAGRSGRDYSLLFEAMENLPYTLHVASDCILPSYKNPRIQVLSDCYKHHYLRELKDATLVVVTLEAEHISAGQMVLIESMALGKTVLITKTDTTMDYAEHNETAYFVPRGDLQKLQKAICFFMEHPEERARIGEQARKKYREMFSMEAYTQNLLQLLQEQQESFQSSS